MGAYCRCRHAVRLGMAVRSSFLRVSIAIVRDRRHDSGRREVRRRRKMSKQRTSRVIGQSSHIANKRIKGLLAISAAVTAATASSTALAVINGTWNDPAAVSVTLTGASGNY